MSAEIEHSIAAFAHVANVAKAFIDARDEAKRNAVRFELQNALAAAQTKHLEVISDYQTLLESHERLKKQLADYDRWEQESTRYKLKESAPRTALYFTDSDQATGEPAHWLCPGCYSKRQKGVMNHDPTDRSLSVYKCCLCPYTARVTETE